MTITRLTQRRTVRRSNRWLAAVAAMGTVGCGTNAADTGSAAATTAAPPTKIQLIDWCPDRDLPDRGRTGPGTDEENALTDAVQGVSVEYEGDPAWAGSYIKPADLGAVFMFTDSDPDRDQAIRTQLASVAVADNVEFRTVTYTESELNAAADSLGDAIPNDGWDGLVTFWGPDVVINRVHLSISDLDAASTLHELIDPPQPIELFCIRPEAVEAGAPDEDI